MEMMSYIEELPTFLIGNFDKISLRNEETWTKRVKSTPFVPSEDLLHLFGLVDHLVIDHDQHVVRFVKDNMSLIYSAVNKFIVEVYDYLRNDLNLKWRDGDELKVALKVWLNEEVIEWERMYRNEK